MASRRLQYCCKNGSGPLAPKRVRRVAPALNRALPRPLAWPCTAASGGGNGRKALGASQRLIPRALRMWTCQSSLQQIKSIVVMCPIASGKKRKKSCCCYCCHHRLARQAKLARKGRTIARGAAAPPSAAPRRRRPSTLQTHTPRNCWSNNSSSSMFSPANPGGSGH